MNQSQTSLSTLTKIPFNQIPHTSKLLLDYCSEKVNNFYPSLENNTEEPIFSTNLLNSLLKTSSKLIRRSYQREQVANALLEQNLRFGSGEKTLKNIELLRESETVAVITGQQAGLFSGPLFTIYKALTAIKLATELSKEGQKAIPIFWIASEDHDYKEVSHFKVINRDGQLTTISHQAQGELDLTPVGNLRISEEVIENINSLLSSLPQSEFIDELTKDLKDSYSANLGFAEGFARLLAKIFANYGVVLLDAQDKNLKPIASPIFETVLHKSKEIAQSLVNRSQILEKSGYHAQVHTSLDMVPLFLLENNHRLALRQQDEQFSLKHSSQTYTSNQLLDKLHNDPTLFSPSVLLRPIVQDYLLPTVAYIGGPAEVAYFAQISAIYPLFPVEFPVIIPRAGFTIIPNRENNLLKKWELNFTDLFAGLEHTKHQVIEHLLDKNTISTFDETELLINQQLDKLSDNLLKVDPTLAEALKGGREKIFYQLHHLKTRFINTNAKREETLVRQIEKLFTLLYPNKNLQERELNIYYFLARYGYDFTNTIYKNLDLDFTAHKILYI
ncbi:MAG: bacillithiol biosynthesis cysteine-adding enzyme BshC [Acidobacteria bacterium]|nr:bacillithiol biosynthesis cysteine-adding enzyme BshC [Acidobacteriota bacterium]